MADVSVRPAGPRDADEIGRIQVETWRTAYQGILPAVVLDALTAEQAAAAWRETITDPPTARHRVLVAVEGQWLVGFTAFGPADPDPDEPEGSPETSPGASVDVAALLVEPRWGRRGHGSRLLAALVDHVRPDGVSRLVTWIPEGDTASRQFLESAGWAQDGFVRALDTGAGELREIRLHTMLDPSGS